MQINELRENRLRELARIHPDDACVLSLFINLDPTEFAAPHARASEISSVIDDAQRRLRERDGLSHTTRTGLEKDIERAASFLRDLSPKGAHGFALFACSAAGLFEGIRLPRPVPTRAVIDDAPYVEPLVEMATPGNWAVVLVNRQTGRMFRGDAHRLDEVEVIVDEVHGQHSQGGWSQARYQRSVDEDVQDHLKNVAHAVFLGFKRRPFDHLLVGGPAETLTDFEGKLHQYARERLAGRIDADVENTNADDVCRAAAPRMAELDRKRDREALDRLREAVSKNGRGAAGLDAVLGALNERRVETLLLNQGFRAAGCTCPQCNSVYSMNGGKCPADGSELECRDDVIESAVHLALEQSAAVRLLREEELRNELQSHGGIAAVLRF